MKKNEARNRRDVIFCILVDKGPVFDEGGSVGYVLGIEVFWLLC